MLKTLVSVLIGFIYLNTPVTNFEGKIKYKISYKSKIPNVSDEQLTAMMGGIQEYYLKSGDYKSVMNGSFMQWQLYIKKDNKLYNKISTSPDILWIDGSENKDSVLKSEIKSNVIQILGYNCDELTLTCKSGIQKYYYNAGLAIDPALFTNHKYGNWIEFVSRSKAVPLKAIVDTEQMTVESTAEELKEMILDKSLFELPADATTKKSPF